jgi:hypothetical protein
MMGECGVSVDHSTIYSWIQTYAHDFKKRLRWQWRRPGATSWCIDEACIKVRGKWAEDTLYRQSEISQQHRRSRSRQAQAALVQMGGPGIVRAIR